MHIINGFANPLEGRLRLNLVLKGIQREKPLVTPTPASNSAHLGYHQRYRGADNQIPEFDSVLPGGFGFLHSGEFTIPSPARCNPAKHLSIMDVAVNSHSNPSILSVHIKASKTDLFGRGSLIYLGHTTSGICPVQAVLQYLAVRPPGDSPLLVKQLT
jgi:hypothetical protein